MLNKPESSEQSSQTSKNSWSNEVFSADATARRRALLKGLGRGTAVLAATVPIQTLAGQLCPTSGTKSARVSQGVSTSESCPTGFSVDFWAKSTTTAANNSKKSAVPLNKWPTGTDPSWKYNSVFVESRNDKAMFQIMTEPTDSDERHWICAWLNAHAISNFPYKPEKVITLSDPSYRLQYDNTLAFLKGYMETRTA